MSNEINNQLPLLMREATKIMDLEARKYHFIQELFSVDEETIMTALERVLKQEKEEHQEISAAHKKELDSRLERYREHPDDVLDWEAVKADW